MDEQLTDLRDRLRIALTRLKINQAVPAILGGKDDIKSFGNGKLIINYTRKTVTCTTLKIPLTSAEYQALAVATELHGLLVPWRMLCPGESTKRAATRTIDALTGKLVAEWFKIDPTSGFTFRLPLDDPPSVINEITKIVSQVESYLDVDYLTRKPEQFYLKTGNLEIDGLLVRWKEELVQLGSLTRGLLLFLATEPGRIFTHDTIQERVWAEPVNPKSVYAVVTELRKKTCKELIRYSAGLGLSLELLD